MKKVNNTDVQEYAIDYLIIHRFSGISLQFSDTNTGCIHYHSPGADSPPIRNEYHSQFVAGHTYCEFRRDLASSGALIAANRKSTGLPTLWLDFK